MRDVFSKLIDAFGEVRLRQHMDERRVLRVAAPGFTDLLPFDMLSAALAQGLFAPPRIRVMAGRRRIDPDRSGLVLEGKVVAPVLEQLARQGATVAASGADHCLPAIWDLCREGEAQLGERLSAVAFASFGPELGLAPHYDGCDVIVVQLAGTKHWHFHGEPIALAYPPRGSQGDGGGPVTDGEVLRAGEIMFVPAGLYHHCSADGASMHLAVTWFRRHGAALAQHLLEQAAGDPLLNAPIGALAGKDAVAAALAASKARLIGLIEAFDAAALVEPARPHEMLPEKRPPGPDPAGPRLAVTLAAA